jgi:Rab GDP dissociation inhibitor
LPQTRYDVVVVGSGLKESLLAGILSKQGRKVLLMEPKPTLGGDSKSMDLQQLAECLEGPETKLSEQRVGDPAEYLIERAPKVRGSQ